MLIGLIETSQDRLFRKQCANFQYYHCFKFSLEWSCLLQKIQEFKLNSDFKPTGDQPNAIDSLVKGIRSKSNQTLLGVTGSGKTFTIANAVARTGKNALVISHNKTLAAQLYSELKQFFPNNNVGYFVSYYDYYQP